MLNQFTFDVCDERLYTLECSYNKLVRSGNKFIKYENLSSVRSSLRSFNTSLRDSLELTRGQRQRLIVRSRTLENKLTAAMTALITLK